MGEAGKGYNGCRHTPPRFVHQRTRARPRRVGIEVSEGNDSISSLRITLRSQTTVALSRSVDMGLVFQPVLYSLALLLHYLLRETCRTTSRSEGCPRMEKDLRPVTLRCLEPSKWPARTSAMKTHRVSKGLRMDALLLINRPRWLHLQKLAG